MKSNLAVVSCKLSHVGAILSGNAGVEVLVGGKGNIGGGGGGRVNPELAAESNEIHSFNSTIRFLINSKVKVIFNDIMEFKNLWYFLPDVIAFLAQMS